LKCRPGCSTGRHALTPGYWQLNLMLASRHLRRSLRCSIWGAVAGLVGIRVGVVSGVINLESSGVEASDWRLRHEQAYHEA
jgi:hypothetical protein